MTILIIFHTFTCRCWQAPCAVCETEESPWANQLQAGITYITGIVDVSLALCMNLGILNCGRRTTRLGCGDNRQVLITGVRLCVCVCAYICCLTLLQNSVLHPLYIHAPYNLGYFEIFVKNWHIFNWNQDPCKLHSERVSSLMPLYTTLTVLIAISDILPDISKTNLPKQTGWVPLHVLSAWQVWIESPCNKWNKSVKLQE